MLTSQYCSGDTFVHRSRPALKILVLFVGCTVVFLWDSWYLLTTVLVAVGLLYFYAKIPTDYIFQSIRPVIWLLVIIFIVQIFLTRFDLAAFVVLRFIAMIMAASLVTLTTKSSEMVEGIESALRFLPNQQMAENISLAISLCLRFIPKVRDIFSEVREAQKARGLSNDWRALVTPVIVRTLKSADEISEAIIARSPDDSDL